jgi:NADPH2:quinone reductase
MKAVWYDRNGPAQEVLEFGDQPTPEPGAGEVRVRIAFSGVNPSDVKRRAGWNNQKLAFPRAIPQMDGSGVIDRVGTGVDAQRVGERVWLHSTAWKRPFGTAAEYAVTPAERAYALPAGTSLQVGATLGVPALTAYRAVTIGGDVAGRDVLVTGGAGAVGYYAIQLAKFLGARVIATVSSPDKAAIARRAGADVILDYRTQDVAAEILKHTAQRGIDHVVEVDFAANLQTSLAVLKPGGAIAAYASMSNPNPPIPFYAAMNRNLRFLTVFVYELPRAILDEGAEVIARWLGSPGFSAPPVKVFPLERCVDAHLAVEGSFVGKVCVSVAGEQA